MFLLQTPVAVIFKLLTRHSQDGDLQQSALSTLRVVGLYKDPFTVYTYSFFPETIICV